MLGFVYCERMRWSMITVWCCAELRCRMRRRRCKSLTAAAGHEERLVYVQAASGGTAQAQRNAVEHAYTAFSDINGEVTSDRKLVVLDDEKLSWIPHQVKLLTRVAFVGTWTDRQRWINFIRGDVPNDSRLLTATDQLILE